MGLKPPLSYEEQIERLKKNGVEIPDHETALSVLSEANYYRLSGYALQFRIDPQKSRYQSGTSFDKIHSISNKTYNHIGTLYLSCPCNP